MKLRGEDMEADRRANGHTYVLQNVTMTCYHWQN